MERGSVTLAVSIAKNPVALQVRAGSSIALASSPGMQLSNNSLTLPPDSVAILNRE